MANVDASDLSETMSKRLFVVPVDDSPHSERAFNYYVNNIYKPGDKVGIVHVHEPPHVSHKFGIWDRMIVENETQWKQDYQNSLKQSQEVVNKYQKMAKDSGIDTEVFLTTNKYSPGHAICDIAEQNKADGIVMGSRGLNLLRRTILGSVSSYVMHHSHTPVTITPDKKTHVGTWTNPTEDSFTDSLMGV